jgi:hypothetical protein
MNGRLAGAVKGPMVAVIIKALFHLCRSEIEKGATA